MKITTIKHKDVRGKENLYIKMTTYLDKLEKEEHETHLINVGEKTFKRIEEMLKNEKHDKK